MSAVHVPKRFKQGDRVLWTRAAKERAKGTDNYAFGTIIDDDGVGASITFDNAGDKRYWVSHKSLQPLNEAFDENKLRQQIETLSSRLETLLADNRWLREQLRTYQAA